MPSIAGRSIVCLFAVGAALALCSGAARAIDPFPRIFAISVPAPGSTSLAIAPGQEAGFSVSFTHFHGTDSLVVGAFLYSPRVSASDYTFRSDDARCAAPTITSNGTGLGFRVGPIGRDETVTCRYHVARGLGSRDDLKFGLCGSMEGSFCQRYFRFGTLPNLAFDVSQVPEDPRADVVRLRVSNPGPHAVDSRIVGTQCLEFFGGSMSPTSFQLSNDLEGGCPAYSPSLPGLGCHNVGGMSTRNYLYRLGPIPAGSEYSCLLRIVRLPRRGISSARIGFANDEAPLVAGGMSYDADATDDSASIGPTGIAVRVTPVPMGLASILSIGLFAVIIGALHLRRVAT